MAAPSKPLLLRGMKHCGEAKRKTGDDKGNGKEEARPPFTYPTLGLSRKSGQYTLQYAASLPGPKVVGLGIDDQATISIIARPGYSYVAPILRDIQKATTSLLHPALLYRLDGPLDTQASPAMAWQIVLLATEGTPRTTSHVRTLACAHRPVTSFSRSGRSVTNRETTSLSLPLPSSQPSHPLDTQPHASSR